jgi:methionyl-tRNA formyltransferase
MIMSNEIEISNDENAGNLHDRLMVLGSETVLQTLALIEDGNIKTTVQKDNATIKTAYKLDKENCKIDYTILHEKLYDVISSASKKQLIAR